LQTEHTGAADANAADAVAGRKLLAISFGFPPLTYPRAVQVARLLKRLDFDTVVLCADEEGVRKDPTLEPETEPRMRAVLRVPFPPRGLRWRANRLAARLRVPAVGQTPDTYAPWKREALRAFDEFASARAYRPDVIATFGQPMSDHLVGLELKRRFRVPWLAHFSDPWVDNPFHRYNALTRKLNLSMEREVMSAADRLVFTSEETVELVLEKYPAAWRSKARVLPHSFEPSLYPPRADTNNSAGDDDNSAGDSQIVVRHTGEFYGRRTPRPLAVALRAVLLKEPRLLEGVRFELIGPASPEALADSGLDSLPSGLVELKAPVGYRQSLALAASADGLLIIDAPAARSVFLPSKLVDYVGAARPILGLTPPGTAARVIGQLGGWVADPSDADASARACAAFLKALRETADRRAAPWGEPRVRESYEARAVTASFEAMLKELLT
jgi:Glycosyl transferase 4-like domain